MAVERAAGGSSLIDVLDRVLDKGIVIDAWVRVSLVGIDLITVEARVVVASIDTYLKYSEAVGQSVPVARPALESRPYDELAAENQALRAELSSAARRAPAGRASTASGSVAFHGEEDDEDQEARTRRQTACTHGCEAVCQGAAREAGARGGATRLKRPARRCAANTCTASSSLPIR